MPSYYYDHSKNNYINYERKSVIESLAGDDLIIPGKIMKLGFVCEDELDDIFVTKPNPHKAEKAIKSRLAQPHPHQEFIDKIEEDSVNGTSTHYAEFCKKFGYDEICWDHWSCEVIYRAANVYVGDQGFVTIDEFAEALGVPVEREDVVEALIANGRMSEDDPDEEIDIESGELLRILLEENDCIVFRGAEVSAMYD